jgi:hypothetical protein
MQTGYNAGATRLSQYITNGYNGSGPLNTISSVGSVYATDPNWASAVSRISGIPLNATLDPTDATQMAALQQGIITQEQGAGPAQTIFGQVTMGGGSSVGANLPGDTLGASSGDQFSQFGTLDAADPATSGGTSFFGSTNSPFGNANNPGADGTDAIGTVPQSGSTFSPGQVEVGTGGNDPFAGSMGDPYGLGAAGMTTAPGALPYTVYAGGAGGSFAPGNPLGYGASGAAAADPGVTDFPAASSGLPPGVSTTGTGNFGSPSNAPATTAPPAGSVTTSGSPGTAGAPDTQTSTGTTATGSTSTGSGTPVDITGPLPSAVSSGLATATTAIGQGAAAVGNSLSGAASTMTSGLTSYFTGLTANAEQYFTRGALVVFGIVLVIVGLIVLSGNRGGGATNITLQVPHGV